MAETRQGFMLGSKLLRAAQVVVSSGDGSADTKEESGIEADAGADEVDDE